MPTRDFESIYTDFSRLVYWTAYGVTKSAQDAMDASQNVFLRVLKHIKKLETMTDPQLRGWLYRVTVNLCLDGKRKLSRELLMDEDIDMVATDEAVLPEPAALSAEKRLIVRSAIDTLPDVYRETVILHYFSGLGYVEIAELTGTTEGTIKSRMFRAKEKLCVLLKEGVSNG
ncbi:MAG: RNA polymerase sigma factor [Clostridia bacterium]